MGVRNPVADGTPHSFARDRGGDRNPQEEFSRGVTMSTQLYVVPLVQTTLPGFVDVNGNPITLTVPEYSVNSGDPLYGVTYASMPLTGLSLALVATAENDSLATESDVFAFPADLTQTMTDADITALTTILASANLPTSFLVSGITYDGAAQTIGAIAQTLQQATGTGMPITLAPVSKGVGKAGGGGSSATQNALLASAAQWTAPLILNAGGGSAL
jgi:hypothetical protein